MMDENMNATLQGLLTENYRQKPITISTEPVANNYTVDSRPFARGKFATVRRYRHKATGVEYAAKHIRKRRRASDVRHEILHEAHVLDLCAGHPHIVQLHEVYENASEIILILEMVSGGELQRLLDDEEVVPEWEATRILRQILSGLTFLHDHRIAHLDLKPQNMLLTKPFPNCEVKLCDFGISRLITKGMEIREIVGTPDYVAPEILHYEPISLPTDMWSIGILTYVLLSGHSPFGGDTKQETFCNITRGTLEFPPDLFDTVSNAAKDFIRRLLIRNPRERMTAKECLKHPWLCQDAPTIHRIEITLMPQESAITANGDGPRTDDKVKSPIASEVKATCHTVTPRNEKKLANDALIPSVEVKCSKNNKENIAQQVGSHDAIINITNGCDAKKQTVRRSVDIKTIKVTEYEGLAVSKTMMFSEEVIKDERVAVVF